MATVDHAAAISVGEFIQASGSWSNDRQHGLQFKARFLKATPPTTVEGIEKYLGSGMIRYACGKFPVLEKSVSKGHCYGCKEHFRSLPMVKTTRVAYGC
ncbi:YrrC family ATP-dependent DNA helicase [Falsochrobactrum shanghaiense]|uniref:YrrC family ATP-dependent DNA helicase n=1 Tax=Falsochrobactrum shanghaiense TaxID=2201899 RepID=UPI003CC9E6C3